MSRDQYTFEILCIRVVLNSVCCEGAAFKHAMLVFFLVDSLMMQTAGRDSVTTLNSVIFINNSLSHSSSFLNHPNYSPRRIICHR